MNVSSNNDDDDDDDESVFLIVTSIAHFFSFMCTLDHEQDIEVGDLLVMWKGERKGSR